MTIPEQINAYIASQPEPKRSGMETLHQLVLRMNPGCRLWFLDGKDGNNKLVLTSDGWCLFSRMTFYLAYY